VRGADNLKRRSRFPVRGDPASVQFKLNIHQRRDSFGEKIFIE